MDLHNNRLGQAIGISIDASASQDVWTAVLSRLRSGDALVLYDPRNTSKNVRLSLLERSVRCKK